MLETRALTPVERTATKVPIQRFFLEARLSSRLTRAVRKPKLGLIVRALFTCRVSQFTNHNDALMICQGWPERWRPRGSGWSSVWGRPGWSWTTETCLKSHHCHRHDHHHNIQSYQRRQHKQRHKSWSSLSPQLFQWPFQKLTTTLLITITIMIITIAKIMWSWSSRSWASWASLSSQRPPQQLTTTLPPAANADSMKSPVACKSYHFWVPHEKYIIWVPHQPSQSTHFLLILVFFAMPWSRHTALYVTGSWNIGNKLAGPWNIGQCQHRQNHCTGSQSSWDLDNYHYHNWNQQNYSSSEVRLLGGPPSSS